MQTLKGYRNGTEPMTHRLEAATAGLQEITSNIEILTEDSALGLRIVTFVDGSIDRLFYESTSMPNDAIWDRFAQIRDKLFMNWIRLIKFMKTVELTERDCMSLTERTFDAHLHMDLVSPLLTEFGIFEERHQSTVLSELEGLSLNYLQQFSALAGRAIPYQDPKEVTKGREASTEILRSLLTPDPAPSTGPRSTIKPFPELR